MPEGKVETDHPLESDEERLLNLLRKIEDAHSDSNFVLVSDLLPYLVDYSDTDIASAKASMRRPRLWPPAQSPDK